MEVSGSKRALDTEESHTMYKYTLRVEYPTPTWATYTLNSLIPDEELKQEKISKTLTVENSTLVVEFVSNDIKMLRTSVSGFNDFLLLATRTLEEFTTPTDAMDVST
mmetsp:Transcript_28247/g.31379  ORF Transcript_28247/g.31379 Transcript_28247/m.31379 type:complete len:107 (+) Transcript_28247:42-362(+)